MSEKLNLELAAELVAVATERDQLRTEVERLKQLIDDCVSEGQEIEAALPSGVAGTWKQRVLAGVERLKAVAANYASGTPLLIAIKQADLLREQVDSLKADKARLDWLEKAKSAEYSEGACGWTINGWNGPYGDTIREAIDAAMKGDK